MSLTLAADPDLGRISLLARLRLGSPALTRTGLVLLVALVPLGIVAAFDPRLVAGHPVWHKPMRFALALAIYTLTLAFFAGWTSEEARRGRLLRFAIAAGVAAIAFEQGWITLQAARGTGSHFNSGTPFETAMWALMGIGALVLTAMAPVIGWLVWRSPRPGLAPALRASAALGLTLTLPLTVVSAGTLASLGGAIVGGPVTGDGGLAVMGWSREAGDLRVAHFFATHALHAVPLAAAASMTVFGRERTAPSFVLAAIYVLFVAAVVRQALAGRPFLPMLG